MQTENLTRTEKIISWAVLAVVISLLNGCAWLLAEKDNIVVVEQKEGTLEITAEYYMAGDDYLLGIPAMMMRVTGLEPPATIQGAAKAIDPRSVGKRAGPHEAILVNATGQELWYTPFIYGDEGSLPRNAPTETAKLPPDSAMRILAKTHGDYRRGCNQKPGGRETFSYDNGEGPSMAILGWITPTTPDACNTAKQATKTTGDNPKLSQKSNTSSTSPPQAEEPVRRGIGMEACSKGFEDAAEIYLHELAVVAARPADLPPTFSENVMRGGAIAKFISENEQCFDDGEPRFQLTGPYSRMDPVMEVVEGSLTPDPFKDMTPSQLYKR